MIHLTAEELARWRAEVDLGVEFRDKEFGTYQQQTIGAVPQTTLAGRNLKYFEQGARSDEDLGSVFNLFFPITKIIVPTLFYQNPRATAIPETRDDQAGEDAFYVSELINRDLRDVNFRFKDTSQQAVFDSFVLGFGVVKVGYATEFGQDILPTKQETRQKFRDRVQAGVQQVMQTIGLIQPKSAEAEPQPEPVQDDLTILSERAYLQWISPFDFVIDPRARDLTDAKWVAQLIRRTLGDIHRDRRYGREKFNVTLETVKDPRIPDTFIEEFQSVDVWEVHYKDANSPTGLTTLTFAATQTQTKALMHEHNVYDLSGWQYEWLCLNKHGHRLYPISTLSVIRPMVDRVSATFDALLEQIDKFQVKIAYNTRVTPDGETALDSPVLGARVKVDGDGDVRGAVAVISMEQVSAELSKFVESLLDIILITVGVTRAQFTGITTAQTATEAQIGQGGQNLRRTDEANVVGLWSNRVVAKLWRVKAQFQDFLSMDLPMEASLLNPSTGLSSIQWYPPIDVERQARLKRTRFGFHLEVGSIQKPNLEIIRAQFEGFVKALMEPIVTQGLALEGKRLSASEVIRQWSRFFEEYGLTGGISKMIVPIQDPALQQALMNFGQKPEQTNGGGQLAGAVPTYADQVSAAAGEKGQGASPA